VQIGSQHQRHHDADIGGEIGEIMCGVGMHRERMGLLHHLALIEDQADGGGDGHRHHQQRLQAVFNRLRVQQPLHGLHHQEQRGGTDEGRLGQSRQRLRLAMAEAMFLVGGRQRRADGEEVQRGSEKVQRAVGHRSQHRHRMRGEIGKGLDRHQQQGNRQ